MHFSLVLIGLCSDRRKMSDDFIKWRPDSLSTCSYPRCLPHPGSHNSSSFASAVPLLPHALHFTWNIACSIGNSSPYRLISAATGSGARWPHRHFAIQTLPGWTALRFRRRCYLSVMKLFAMT